jgi:hypothetical protein
MKSWRCDMTGSPGPALPICAPEVSGIQRHCQDHAARRAGLDEHATLGTQKFSQTVEEL